MVTCWAPLSVEFSRQEHWRGLSFPTPGDLPDPRVEPVSLVFPALAGGTGSKQYSSKLLTSSKARGTQEDMVTKCHKVSWIGSWNGKGTVGSIIRKPNELWALVNATVLV